MVSYETRAWNSSGYRAGTTLVATGTLSRREDGEGHVQLVFTDSAHAGPPLVVELPLDGRRIEFDGRVSGALLVSGCARVLMLSAAGLVTFELLIDAVSLVPTITLGTWIDWMPVV